MRDFLEPLRLPFGRKSGGVLKGLEATFWKGSACVLKHERLLFEVIG